MTLDIQEIAERLAKKGLTSADVGKVKFELTLVEIIDELSGIVNTLDQALIELEERSPKTKQDYLEKIGEV
jgi:hypothetical protein